MFFSKTNTWTFLLLYSIYSTVVSAQAACPKVCVCVGNRIKCTGGTLLQIPKWIPKDVTNLDLSGNHLSSFENDSLLDFPNLIELNLNNNNFTNVASLGNFPKSLQILHLSGNKLKALNANWNQFSKLDFSQNQIESVGNETFSGIQHLIELNLSKNQIRSISPTALKNLSNLQTLRLDENNLTYIPKIQCTSLKLLDLSNNNIHTVESLELSDMIPAIETLKLSSNRIEVLETASFLQLNKLKTLYLNDNLLPSVVRDWMFGLETLEYLYVENNKIVNISTLSWTASCCGKLKYINLANNKLKRVLFDDDTTQGGNFKDLNNLAFLNLSSNEILEIADNAFKSLQRLKILDLSNNAISLVNKRTFEKLPVLETLDLKDNPLMEITRESFSSLEKLTQLRMSSDKLFCSCKLRWFSKWLKTKRFSRSISLKCDEPERLHGNDFTTTLVKDLVCDSSRLEIFQHPQSEIAMRGEEVSFSCTVKNGSVNDIQILWQKDMKAIDLNKTKVKTNVQETNVLYYKESILYLSNVTDVRDDGQYRCLVVAGKQRIPSNSATLRVFVAPKFTQTPGELVTNVGDDVYFNCSASGHPKPSIFFRRDHVDHGDDLPAANEGRVVLVGQTFGIRNVSRSDVGLYRCFAASEAGNINTTFELNIIGKPVPVHKMLDKVALLNDAAVFVCAASGWPRPRYKWYKNDQRLDLTSQNMQLRQERNAQHLVILHARSSDAGKYKCRVSNTLGSFELTSNLEVVEDFSEEPTTSDKQSITNKTLVGAVIFTAACTMVVTMLVAIGVLHVITRRRCGCITRRKTRGNVTLDSFAVTVPENREYVQITTDESTRSSSTFVTSSESRPHSDSNYLQTSSSESSSSKEHRDGLYDGRHSSGVCSMNSSTSSLASNSYHRNTFPFSNTKTYLYTPSDVRTDVTSDVIPIHRKCEHVKYKNKQYYPGRRKHTRDRSRDRSRDKHANKRRKTEGNSYI